jgi:hypothetical protein
MEFWVADEMAKSATASLDSYFRYLESVWLNELTKQNPTDLASAG